MNEPDSGRWPLIRNMLFFQVKLALDAVRDLLLSPVSIICGLVDIFKGHSLSKSYFRKLMNFGQQTDLWLNLFGNHSTDKDTEDLNTQSGHKENGDVNIDQLFFQVESLLKEQHSKGGLTTSAKSSINNYLNKIAAQKNSINSANEK